MEEGAHDPECAASTMLTFVAALDQLINVAAATATRTCGAVADRHLGTGVKGTVTGSSCFKNQRLLKNEGRGGTFPFTQFQASNLSKKVFFLSLSCFI
jgi:hypothetical protein